jgi:hypothetical protein
MTSPREDVAQELLETIKFGGLDEVYGASLSKEVDAKGKSFYSVTFCKSRVLDGVIKVYSERFVMVKWQTQYRDLPAKGQVVCKNSWDAKSLIQSFIRA